MKLMCQSRVLTENRISNSSWIYHLFVWVQYSTVQCTWTHSSTWIASERILSLLAMMAVTRPFLPALPHRPALLMIKRRQDCIMRQVLKVQREHISCSNHQHERCSNDKCVRADAMQSWSVYVDRYMQKRTIDIGTALTDECNLRD